MNIKDLTASTELDSAAMSAVRGCGTNGNADADQILQTMGISVPVAIANGPGSASNNFINVTGTQDATQVTEQGAGDAFFALLGAYLGR
jgi:hypothetical protein